MTPEKAAALVDRSAVWAGQLVSYGVGELEMLSLRRQAEAELGPKFDIQAFHELLLAHGAITVGMLREEVARWIGKRK
jgi:uncharacterized protein (DUF885 family)